MASPLRDALHFSNTQAQQIDPYLPMGLDPETQRPHVTLTFATSLDSQLSLAPGIQTVLSGPESKAMTHYLRSKHDAILIGVGTAVADNPSLNCRFEGVGGYGGEGLGGQPTPIVLDPSGRWEVSKESKVMKLAAEGKGRAPWIITRFGALSRERRSLLESVGGRVFEFDTYGPRSRFSWLDLFLTLGEAGIESIMVEGGGEVINDLLSDENAYLVGSVIVTIAPVWLGRGGVQVCPKAKSEPWSREKVPVQRLKEVRWVPLGEDVVLCGYPTIDPRPS